MPRGGWPESPAPRTRAQASNRLLPETENGQQRFVDAPLLLRSDPADQLSEAAGVDSANLLDKDAGDLTQQVDLGAERRRPRAERCRSYQYDGARQELVRLHNDAIPAALLLVADTSWSAEFVNVTPEHACSP